MKQHLLPFRHVFREIFDYFSIKNQKKTFWTFSKSDNKREQVLNWSPRPALFHKKPNKQEEL